MNGRKIGLLTVAIGFISVGSIIIFHMAGLVPYSVLQYLWPLLIILFGIEIMFVRLRQKEGRIRFSFWSVMLLFLIILMSLAQYSLPRNFNIGTILGPNYVSQVSGQVTVNDKIKRVEIEIPLGYVTITGIKGQAVAYSGELSAYGSSQADADKLVHAKWEVQQSGDTLEMILNDTGSRSGIDLDFLHTSPYLDVRIPQSLLTKVSTHDAFIQVSQMNANTDVETSNGSVTIQAVHGNVTATSSNGSLNISDIAGTANLYTSNGNIVLSNISGPVSANTSNGLIKALSDIQGNWDCNTSNASISLTVPPSTSAKMTAITTNAHIDGDVNWTFDESHHGYCTLGNGINEVHLRTSNGNISVDKSRG